MGRKGSELCASEKESILSLSKANIKLKEISEITGRPISTICSFLKRQERRGITENKNRSGRPLKCSVQGERQLIRLVKNNRRRTLTELTNVSNENGASRLSESTVKRILRKGGYRRRLVKKKLRIREVNKKKRVNWCKQYRHKTVDDFWNNIIFSDECKVMIDGEQRVYVWRKDGEEWDPPCVAPPPGRRLDLMVWGCITAHGVGTLCIVDGNINAEKYIEIIDSNLWPVVAMHFPNNQYIFQDDNAPVHRARVVKDFVTREGITTLEWPAQSPDLNIIENCWKKMKHEINRNVHNLRTNDDLAAAVRQAWENIPLQFIQRLYQSIPRRIQAVIKSKGCLTKY